MTGTVTFAKDEYGRRVDNYDFKYIVPEPPKRANANNTKEKEKAKTYEDYVDGLRDFKLSWLSKLGKGFWTILWILNMKILNIFFN